MLNRIEGSLRFPFLRRARNSRNREESQTVREKQSVLFQTPEGNQSLSLSTSRVTRSCWRTHVRNHSDQRTTCL